MEDIRGTVGEGRVICGLSGGVDSTLVHLLRPKGSAALTVTHGDISGLSISPAAATITTAGSQAYAVQAADIAGNVWVPDAASYTWDEDGAGGFTGNAYTPDAADAGHNVSIRAIAGSVQSNAASLHVYGVSGAGLILAWDKDDQSFYLCQNPANPASAGALGLVPATNGWHDVNGVRVLVSGAKGNRTVAVANTAGLRVLPSLITDEPYTIAARRQDAKLVEAIGAIIEDMQTNGELEALTRRWMQ